MTGPAIFILLWGVAAIGMGAFFVLLPSAMERTATRLGQRVGYTERTRRLQVHLNRIGGVMFVISGTVVIVLVLTGVLTPADA